MRRGRTAAGRPDQESPGGTEVLTTTHGTLVPPLTDQAPLPQSPRGNAPVDRIGRLLAEYLRDLFAILVVSSARRAAAPSLRAVSMMRSISRRIPSLTPVRSGVAATAWLIGFAPERLAEWINRQLVPTTIDW